MTNPPNYPPWGAAFQPPALRRAWLSVRGNGGGAGADGQTVTQFEQALPDHLAELSTQLRQQTYRPHKVTQMLVPKRSGDGWRPLTVWALRDRIAQRAAYNYLAPVLDPHLLPCSYGFRTGRSTAEAATAVHHLLRQGYRWVLDADIKDCFGQMQHALIQNQLRQWYIPLPLQQLIQQWLAAKVWNGWPAGQRQAGTAQGSAISPLLCNLYLHPFDVALSQHPDVYLVRYADDFVLLGRRKADITAATDHARATLAQLGLQLNEHKTTICYAAQGFRFVGWFFLPTKMYPLR